MLTRTVSIRKKIDIQRIYREISEWIYIISLCCLFLKTFNFKFFFNISESFLLIVSFVPWIIYVLSHKVSVTKRHLSEILILFSIFFLQVCSNHFEGILGQAMLLLTMACLILTTDEFKKDLLKAIIYVFSIICLVSLIGWIAVCIFKIRIPFHIITFQNYKFYDYGFFNIRVEGIEFSRYLGMFIEPGYTGVMCVLLLVANGFDFKRKENIILLISALATLSLASYIMLFVYLIIKKHTFSFVKKTILGILIVSVIILLTHKYIYDLTWIYEYFLKNRIQGLLTTRITGNRFTDAFNDYFRNNIINNPANLFFGVGSVNYFETATRLYLKSAGFKVYIAQFGIVNLILICIFYFREICKEYSYIRISIYVLWVLSFIDMAYPTWACFLIYAICIDVLLKERYS